jgi:hypothetical protein
MLTQWDNPCDEERNIRWTRELHTALQPWVEDAVYVNNLGDQPHARITNRHRLRDACDLRNIRFAVGS